MAKLSDDLLSRLENKLGVSRNRVYRLIATKVNETHLPRHLAAIYLASQNGINISRFASEEDLQQLRNVTNGQRISTPVAAAARMSQQSKKRATRTGQKKTRGKSVFIVHGRNLKLRDELFTFLRALKLDPIEWNQAIKKTKQASPYIGTILEAAFQQAVAIIVLLTPDDEARLQQKFWQQSDPSSEKKLMGQARANVLFEAGMAFAHNANSTILVQVGKLRPFSDTAGRHVLHLDNSSQKRQEFVTKLQNAGCLIDMSGTDWLRVGNFSA